MTERLSRADQQRLKDRHAQLVTQLRLAYGAAAHSVLLTSTLSGSTLSTGISAFDVRGHNLPPLSRYPDVQLMGLLDALMVLHGPGHWLLDPEPARPAPERRPLPGGLLGPGATDPPPWTCHTRAPSLQ